MYTHMHAGHMYHTRLLTPELYDPLTDLMNDEIREKLGIIPDDVIWGGLWAREKYFGYFTYEKHNYDVFIFKFLFHIVQFADIVA